MAHLPGRIASVSLCLMSDETGPKLTVEAIERKRAKPPLGRKPHLTEEMQKAVAAEYYADEDISMRALATKHGVSVSVIRRAIKRVAERVTLESVRRRCL